MPPPIFSKCCNSKMTYHGFGEYSSCDKCSKEYDEDGELINPEVDYSMNYTILRGDTYEDLINMVRSYIKTGWKPQGGICFASFPYFVAGNNVDCDNYYLQAMIKE